MQVWLAVELSHSYDSPEEIRAIFDTKEQAEEYYGPWPKWYEIRPMQLNAPHEEAPLLIIKRCEEQEAIWESEAALEASVD